MNIIFADEITLKDITPEIDSIKTNLGLKLVYVGENTLMFKPKDEPTEQTPSDNDNG